MKSLSYQLRHGLILCALAASATALAQNAQGTQGTLDARHAPADMGAMKQKFEARFAAADTDHDGKLSKKEAEAMPRIAKVFDQIDDGHTGYVTAPQIEAYMLKQRK